MINQALWQQLLQLNGPDTAKRTLCIYEHNGPHYRLKMLNADYLINLASRKICRADTLADVTFAQQLCILAYLINARDAPIADRLVPPESLPNGQFFFRGPHKLPTQKLARVFGQQPQLLTSLVEKFNARTCPFGDASIQLLFLPRLPLTFIIWRQDEEFDARASILFDQTAALQLPLDALWMAANLAVNGLINAVRLQ